MKTFHNKKLMRFIGASSLAIIMGAGVLCGVLVPVGGGSAAASMTSKSSQSGLVTGQNASGAATAQSADSALTPQEQLLAGTWECNPETDPIIYTTESGIDIRWSMAGLPEYSDNILINQSGNQAGYAYITAAGYNWAIIGYSNKTTTISTGTINVSEIAGFYHSEGYYNKTNTTTGMWQLLANSKKDVAGKKILSDYLVCGDVFYNSFNNSISAKDIFPKAVATDELETNEVLCISQSSVGNSYFVESNRVCAYPNSTLRTQMDLFYEENLTSLPIIPKSLITVYYESLGEPEGPFHIFPLASMNANTESFYYDTYLDLGANGIADIDATYWLRSGLNWANAKNSAYCITGDGAWDGWGGYLYSLGMRPAFVLKI